MRSDNFCYNNALTMKPRLFHQLFLACAHRMSPFRSQTQRSLVEPRQNALVAEPCVSKKCSIKRRWTPSCCFHNSPCLYPDCCVDKNMHSLFPFILILFQLTLSRAVGAIIPRGSPLANSTMSTEANVP